MRWHQGGLTLIELLVVLAIIGILMGIFGWNMIRSIRAAELREAAAQVAVDLRQARSLAQRSSSDIVLVLPGSAGANTYKVDTNVKSIPYGVRLICRSNCGTSTTTNVTYQAPYGELGAIGSIYIVRSPMSGIGDYEIRIVGVTGKIILAKAGG
ncbi:pilus assembly FimT family protein [Deinococcus wulumuqiensis]|uniref:Pili assembly chaperone n=1 Tax=Deinococcus wulumuqiensis TaxID=980427 RepID=A0AAV4K4W6_9DEIO|nr:type II secretion system protein [Deinococcus wulumuqiensis]QII20365.1 type II secretion system protein [Deinococcus wulumuqiensis R12]GGI82425.1 pili assembly chaperone [Deinococcus wulumuqiensis]GGP29457.1 pili assembly chaperone [Deinococcus wulumuqiensis]